MYFAWLNLFMTTGALNVSLRKDRTPKPFVG